MSKKSAASENRLYFRYVSLMIVVTAAIVYVYVRNNLTNSPINWVTYSSTELDRNLQQGQTVLVNFRATWDASMVMHEPIALETPKVRRWIRKHNVIAMRADYTTPSPQIKEALESIDQIAIPVVAIYPASSPDAPIVVRGRITEQKILDGLDRSL